MTIYYFYQTNRNNNFVPHLSATTEAKKNSILQKNEGRVGATTITPPIIISNADTRGITILYAYFDEAEQKWNAQTQINQRGTRPHIIFATQNGIATEIHGYNGIMEDLYNLGIYDAGSLSLEPSHDAHRLITLSRATAFTAKLMDGLAHYHQGIPPQQAIAHASGHFRNYISYNNLGRNMPIPKLNELLHRHNAGKPHTQDGGRENILDNDITKLQDGGHVSDSQYLAATTTANHIKAQDDRLGGASMRNGYGLLASATIQIENANEIQAGRFYFNEAQTAFMNQIPDDLPNIRGNNLAKLKVIGVKGFKMRHALTASAKIRDAMMREFAYYEGSTPISHFAFEDADIPRSIIRDAYAEYQKLSAADGAEGTTGNSDYDEAVKPKKITTAMRKKMTLGLDYLFDDLPPAPSTRQEAGLGDTDA